jgi:hypothetical protein
MISIETKLEDAITHDCKKWAIQLTSPCGIENNAAAKCKLLNYNVILLALYKFQSQTSYFYFIFPMRWRYKNESPLYCSCRLQH